MRVYAFDLDDTLAKTGEGMKDADLALLRRLEETGGRIIICSGKPTYYLCGFARQLGLKDPVLVGENGAAYVFGVGLPPRVRGVYPFPKETTQNIARIREAVTALFDGQIWCQPNEICFTPFPVSAEEFARIDAFIAAHPEMMQGVSYFRHFDSFDFVPEGLSKAKMLALLCDEMGISAEDITAVGDGTNDYPMFAFAGHAVGVNVKDESRVDVNFATTNEALAYLLARAGEERA